MEKNNKKARLYLLPALIFLAVFMVYPLIDVFIYSFEEGYNSASQTFNGYGLYNFEFVLHDPYFIQAVKNTFILVVITVPLSTFIALLISLGLTSIKKLRDMFQTIYFLPYVTNTLAVGLVFMIMFKPTAYSDGLINVLFFVMDDPDRMGVAGLSCRCLSLLPDLCVKRAVLSVIYRFHTFDQEDAVPVWHLPHLLRGHEFHPGFGILKASGSVPSRGNGL